LYKYFSLVTNVTCEGGWGLDATAVGTQDVGGISEKASSHERHVAFVADETVAVPMSVLKRNKLCPAKSRDWLGAANALLGEEISEAVSAIWLFISRCKLFTCQNLVAVGATEAFAMPRSPFVGHAALVDNPVALHATLGVIFLIARNAHHFLVTWDKTFCSNWLTTNFATKALFMPLLAFVLIFLHSCTEDVSASVASRGKVVVMTISAIKLLVFRCKWLIHKRLATVAAFKAFLVPMFVFVGQILRVGANGGLALFARVSEETFVTLEAERMLVTEDVAMSNERQVAVVAAEARLTSLLNDGLLNFCHLMSRSQLKSQLFLSVG